MREQGECRNNRFPRLRAPLQRQSLRVAERVSASSLRLSDYLARQGARNQSACDLELSWRGDVLLPRSVPRHWLKFPFSSCTTIHLPLCRCERRCFLSPYAEPSSLDRQWNFGTFVTSSLWQRLKTSCARQRHPNIPPLTSSHHLLPYSPLCSTS